MRRLMRIAKWTILCAGLLGVTACMERVYRHRYLSLEEVPGIRVDRTARFELKGMFLNAAIPVEYHLTRERYTLRFTIPDQSYDPGIRVAVDTGGDIGNLSLTYHPARHAYAPNGSPCAGVASVGERSFDFGWAGECNGPQQRVIHFDVIGRNGAVVGEERIAFAIKDNGFYHVTDTL